MSDSNKSVLNGQFTFSDKTTVVCKYCSKHFKYHHSTSTLQYHLRNTHPFASPASDPQLAGKESHPEKRQLTSRDVNERGKPMHQAKYDQLTNYVAKWVAQDCRPLNVVEDDGLQKLIRCTSGNEAYVMPSRKTISMRISTLYESEKVKIQGLLSNADHIALTTDYWTSVANESFLGVTAHFLTEKLNYHATVIGVCHGRSSFCRSHSSAF